MAGKIVCLEQLFVGTYLAPNRAPFGTFMRGWRHLNPVRREAPSGERGATQTRRWARHPSARPRHLVAPPRLFVPFGRIRRIAERRPDINSTTRVENEMIRFAIAMF